jgi:hypothetical protein
LTPRAQVMFDGVRRVRLIDAADLLLVRSSVAGHRIHLTALGLRDERGYHARSSPLQNHMRQIDTDLTWAHWSKRTWRSQSEQHKPPVRIDDLRGTGCVVDRTHRCHENAGKTRTPCRGATGVRRARRRRVVVTSRRA